MFSPRLPVSQTSYECVECIQMSATCLSLPALSTRLSQKSLVYLESARLGNSVSLWDEPGVELGAVSPSISGRHDRPARRLENGWQSHDAGWTSFYSPGLTFLVTSDGKTTRRSSQEPKSFKPARLGGSLMCLEGSGVAGIH